MFSKSKSQTATAGATPASRPAAGDGAGVQRPAKSGGGVPSIVSADLKITGDLNSSGDIQVDGTVTGDVAADTLTIGEQGQVYGKVRGERVRVCGGIEGEIDGGTVTLAASARVVGDIVHDSLAIEPGAHLEGHCRRRAAQAAQGRGRETGRTEAGKASSADAGAEAQPANGSAPEAGEPNGASSRNGSGAGAS
jgi:cytoskeletal protein CcmA (bactofilin family)